MSDVVLYRLLVKVREWDDARIDELVGRLGGKILRKCRPIRWITLEINPADASRLCEAYAQEPGVEDVEFPSVAKPLSVVPYHFNANDPLLPTSYALARMSVFRAWRYARGAGMAVANNDVGLSAETAAAFAGKTILTWNTFYDVDRYYTFTEYQDDGSGGTIPIEHTVDVVKSRMTHGDATMSVMAARGNDGLGPSGVAPEADPIMFITGYESESVNLSSNTHEPTNAELIEGIIHGFDAHGIRIFNVSMGDPLVYTIPPATWLAQNAMVRDGLYYLRDQGALVFFAAGNLAVDTPKGAYQYPGVALPLTGHFAVACTSAEDLDRPVWYSTCGPETELATPGNTAWAQETPYLGLTIAGVEIPEGWTSGALGGASTETIASRDGTVTRFVAPYGAFNGTSCAAPLAAGACALVWSAHPGLDGRAVRQIMLETGDYGSHPEFKRRMPGAVIPNCARGVLKALSLNPGRAGEVFPMVHFQGRGAILRFDSGAPVLHLYGNVPCTIEGFSSDPIVSVELWAGADDLVYAGPPRDRDDPLDVAAARFEGKAVRVIARTATGSVEEQYSDVVGHAVSSTPPKTIASPAAGQYPRGATIALTATTEHPPVRTFYRWDAEAWREYDAPIPVRAGTLKFYSIDALGNVEGGVDYAGGG